MDKDPSLSMQQIVKILKAERGKAGYGYLVHYPRNNVEKVDPSNGIRGRCVHNQFLLDDEGLLHGWRSNEAKVPGQQFPGHSLGVFNLGTGNGAVVDFTSSRLPIGIVENLNDQNAVAEQLKKITGFGGWRICGKD